MSNLTKYGEWGDDAAKQDAAASTAGSKAFLKLVEGDNVMRFLPPKIGRPSPFAVTYSHYVELPTGDKVSFNCPRMMAKRSCIVCAKGDQLRSSRSAADQKAGKRLFPRLRVYANVIDRNAEEKGVQILAFGKGVMEDLTGIRQNPRKGGNFTHPETGRDIIIGRKGTGQFDTEYDVAPDIQASPLHHDPGQADEWLEMAYDLDQFLTVLSDEEIRAKVRGEEAEPEPQRNAPRIAGRGATPVAPRGRTVENDVDSFDPNEFDT
jgi:hypothetical protein